MAFDLVEDISVLIEAAIPNVIVKSEFPDDIDNCVAISENGGYPPTHTFGANTKPIFIEPSFQVFCRHLNSDTMHQWWDAIKSALDGKTDYTPAETTRKYLAINQSGDVIPMGRDDNRRNIEVLNFNTMIIDAY